MAGFKTLKFTASTIDRDILGFPQVFYLRCSIVEPLGVDIVRQYNGNECIVARSVFQVMYAGQLLGTTEFKTLDDFIKYKNNCCAEKGVDCNLKYNGCVLIYNNCFLKNNQ